MVPQLAGGALMAGFGVLACTPGAPRAMRSDVAVSTSPVAARRPAPPPRARPVVHVGRDAGGGTVFYDFARDEAATLESTEPFGSVTLGVDDAGVRDDPEAALLYRGGTPATGPGGHATELETVAKFGFGEYRFKARFATCQPTEELVNGLFLYENDGRDHDGDGLVDNDEIDIEVLCAQPTFINVTSWTECSPDGRMRKKSRAIDLETGAIYIGNTDADGIDRKDPLTGTIDPALRHPGWYDPAAYYEMGWVWHADRLRWFIVLDGAEITLWDFRDTTRIPKEPGTMRFNLWHPRKHWNENGVGTAPRRDAVLTLAWFAFTAAR